MRWLDAALEPPRPIALPAPGANTALTYKLGSACYWKLLAVFCTLDDTDAALAQVPVVHVFGDDGQDYLAAPGGGETVHATTIDYSWWCGAVALNGDDVFSAPLPDVWLYGGQTVGIKVVNHDGTAATAFTLTNARLLLAQALPYAADEDD